MSPAGGIWAPAALRLLRQTAITTTKMLRSKLAAATRPLNGELQPVAATVRSSGGRQPIHPSALLRQQKRSAKAWFSTTSSAALRRLLSTTTTSKPLDRARLPVSTISRAVSQLPGRAPFASTLRPNLTAGAFPRTAGGYSFGAGAGRAGSARYFSHTPASPAQVVQEVSQAVRAFWLSGQRARLDGTDHHTGRPRYRAVSAAHEAARVRMSGVPAAAPGAHVDFRLAPTVTALSPLAAATADDGAVFGPTTTAAAAAAAFNKTPGTTLHAAGFLDVLSTDFARALRDLAAVMADLKRLADGLGDLPVELVRGGRGGDLVRVRFPGVDAAAAEALCADVGVLRGVVGEDPAFARSAGVPVALRFPFAPGAKTLTSPAGSVRSRNSALEEEEEDEAFFEELERGGPWLVDEGEEGYESLSPPVYSYSGEHCSEDFEGLEGIYRFLEECDRVRNPF